MRRSLVPHGVWPRIYGLEVTRKTRLFFRNSEALPGYAGLWPGWLPLACLPSVRLSIVIAFSLGGYF